MKNKILFILFLFVIFISFTLYKINSLKLPSYKVLDVIRADLFYVDFNNNSIADKSELCKLKDIYAFSDELNDFARKQIDNLHINTADYLKAGYLAQSWAQDNLKGKEIQITSLIIDKTKNYNYIEANLNGESLSDFYLKNGLAFAKENTNNQNIKQVKLNANELSKLNFYLLNLNSNIYHKLNCEFANLAHKARLVLSKDLKNYIPCKSCINTHFKKPSILPKTQKPAFYKQFGNVELYFTDPLNYKKPDNTCSNNICKRLIQEINQANSTIDIALYGFGDIDKIYSALKEARKRGVKIRAVVDYSSKMDEIYPKTRDFINEFSAITDDSEIIMHNKFFIFDNKKVLTGSANISSSGIGGYSANSVVIVNSKTIANRYKAEFEQMYNNKFSTLKDKLKIVSDGNITAYFSPKDNIKDVILNNINSAKSEIYVSAFYLTQKDIINALIEAKNRNIQIFVIQDAVGANNFKDRLLKLRKAGISVIVENWGGKNHEKTIMLDNKTLILGSANFSNAALSKNDENVVVIENKEIADFYKNYFFYLYNSIDKKCLTRIPGAEGKESINSCTDGIDNDFDGKIDEEDAGCN